MNIDDLYEELCYNIKIYPHFKLICKKYGNYLTYKNRYYKMLSYTSYNKKLTNYYSLYENGIHIQKMLAYHCVIHNKFKLLKWLYIQFRPIKFEFKWMDLCYMACKYNRMTILKWIFKKIPQYDIKHYFYKCYGFYEHGAKKLTKYIKTI